MQRLPFSILRLQAACLILASFLLLCSCKKDVFGDVPTGAVDTVSVYRQSEIEFSDVDIVWYTDTVKIGDKATVTIKAKPFARYNIAVLYQYGKSRSQALKEKTADKNGYVSWKWRVTEAVESGTHKVEISDSDGLRFRARLTVIE